MPRFYFDVVMNDETKRDEDGLELADVPAARREAVTTLAEMAAEEIPRDGNLVLSVQVKDEVRRSLFRAQLMFAIGEDHEPGAQPQSRAGHR